MTQLRTAIVKGGADDLRQVRTYMPANYDVVQVINPDGDEQMIIVGYDRAGWTMDDYVLPRLASGLIFAEEVREEK